MGNEMARNIFQFTFRNKRKENVSLVISRRPTYFKANIFKTRPRPRRIVNYIHIYTFDNVKMMYPYI